MEMGIRKQIVFKCILKREFASIFLKLGLKRESDTCTDTRSSLIPMAERAHRDTPHATPNGTESYTRPGDVPVRSLPVRRTLCTATYRASCVSLPMRSAKRPL